MPDVYTDLDKDKSFSLFGFEIRRKDPEQKAREQAKSFVPPEIDDDTSTVMSGAPGGFYSTQLDIESNVKSVNDLIRRYRQASLEPEVEFAIDDITNEAIVEEESSAPVSLNLDDLDQPEKIKDMIFAEFAGVCRLLNFNFSGSDIFRRWYIDGRLFYHMIIADANTKKGIIELRPIDPLNIRKVRELQEEKDPKTGATLIKRSDEYFIYSKSESGQHTTSGVESQTLKIAKDAILYVPSGYVDRSRKIVVSPLNKALKPINQLRWMEDALVIYRLSRAPERRLFYIDVGNLPTGKAEDYVNKIMQKYRNKLVYDATTGAIKDDTRTMSILEDFWLPRKEGGRGTEISTLPGGENLGQIEDIEFFKRKLYRALNVPISRLEPDAAFSLGRSSEITRDEVKFQKFINRLRKKFSVLFMELLKTQLILKGIITSSDWESIKEDITIDYLADSHFAELKNTEVLSGRIQLLTEMEQYIGKFYSNQWIRKNVLMLTDEEIDEIEKQMKTERAAGEYDEFEGDDSGFDEPPPRPEPEPEPPAPIKKPDDEEDEDVKEKETGN